MSSTFSAPLVRLSGRNLILDRNRHGADVHVIHEDGTATLCVSWRKDAPSMPRPALDPIGRCSELDAWLPHDLTLRPPSATTAWLLTPGGQLVGLCLATGDIYALLPLEDNMNLWETVDMDIWDFCGPALRQTRDRLGLVVRSAGTPAVHDWWWSLAPTWLSRNERGRYVIPGVISEQTVAAALWAVIGTGDNDWRPLFPLNMVEFTSQVEICAQWHYRSNRLSLWTDNTVTVADSENDLQNFYPPEYSPFVIPMLTRAAHPTTIRPLVEAAPQP